MYKTRWEGTVHRDHGWGFVRSEGGGRRDVCYPPHTSSQQRALFHQGRQTASSSTFTAAGVVVVVDIAVTS